MNLLTNEQVIRKLQSLKEQDKDEAFAFLYDKMYKSIRRYILKNKGTSQDVDDIFHNGLIAFYLAARKGTLPENTIVEAYLFTICRNLWRKQQQHQVEEVELRPELNQMPEQDIPLRTILQGERKKLIEKLLEKLGPECQQLMVLYYYERLRMREIAAQMALSGEQVAKNKKSKCLKTLRTLVLSSPMYTDLLK